MANGFKRLLIGRPLKNEDIHGQKYGVLWGLPILASDAVSSVAYASEEILLVLVPAIGILSYRYLGFISAAIIALLVILSFSYRQTIQSYPSGGGAYIVASDNLGRVAGVTAGAALAVDYTLTVAVSISSGTAAIISALPVLVPFKVPICIAILFILMVGNLRGIKESSRMFSIPAYAFVLAILSMLVVGLIKIKSGYIPPEPTNISRTIEPITMILILSAFSNGCAALTGVEAVSNAVPNFKEPSREHAKKVLVILSALVFLMFGGTSLLANLYHVVPQPNNTVLSQIAYEIFGKGLMYYYIQVATTVILAMAANTAYSDFPLLLSIMAREGFAPKQLSMRGDRLSFSNGILLLSVMAGILIVIFHGNTNALIPLYSIGVFVSFTLSQSGMFIRWLKIRDKHWHYKAFVNGLGALVTFVVVIIIAITKFKHGAWIVIIIIPTLISLMLKVKKHYTALAKQLRIEPGELSSIKLRRDNYINKVIVPIQSINKASIRAIRYACTISNDVTVFTVCIDEEGANKIKEKYAQLNTDIPLVVKYSPFRKVVEPLLKYIESAEYSYTKGEMITVILPQFAVRKWWHNVLHNHSRVFIERELLKHKHIVISTMPLQLKDDEFILKSKEKKS